MKNLSSWGIEDYMEEELGLELSRFVGKTFNEIMEILEKVWPGEDYENNS